VKRVLTLADVADRMRSRQFLREVWRYGSVTVRTTRVGTMRRPFISLLVARLMSRGSVLLTDRTGAAVTVGFRELASAGFRAAADGLRSASLLRSTDATLTRLDGRHRLRTRRPLLAAGSAFYLRTDLWFGLTSGGSVAHVSGVVNELADQRGPGTFLLTTDQVPGIRTSVGVHVVQSSARFWDYSGLPELAGNSRFVRATMELARHHHPAFIYQRYSLNNFAGLQAAQALGVPFVVEFNGSMTWMGRYWGKPLRRESLSERVELAVLRGADLVVVVSEALRDDIVRRGIDPAAILVNPNGVDVDRYHPNVDGSSVRDRLGLGDSLVVGFIGTFEPWHGAEILAEAFAALVRRQPDRRDRVRLLLIGDGPRRVATERLLNAAGALDLAALAGRTDQSDGPAHLAACDILVAPHVRNRDGSPFFGSPTKLFEYMAMGRAIVASRMDQIGEVLEADKSAVLVEPGDPSALASALTALLDDPDRRQRLGDAARDAAVKHHTWRAHTERILAALEARCG
jgi:glycosyltransferase involved in cell wall biosynthesis